MRCHADNSTIRRAVSSVEFEQPNPILILSTPAYDGASLWQTSATCSDMLQVAHGHGARRCEARRSNHPWASQPGELSGESGIYRCLIARRLPDRYTRLSRWESRRLLRYRDGPIIHGGDKLYE